ncbi:MAG: dethiobiotin synthase [Candidatus Omnitrophota bacterium]|nr:dethiobiotin synthase [Candidatus Omnitrophota bacterium]
MKGILVTGTDTGVGKTVIAGLLAKYMLEKGHNVITQKWIQTGCSDFVSSDAGLHLKIMGREKKDIKDYLRHILPYKFRAASSPHLACLIENRRISADKVIKSFRILSKRFDLVIVEGTGGVLVPCGKKKLLIDIAKELGLAALIVAQNRLGAINHTLLTIEALRKRRIKILGIIFNNPEKENRIILKDNPVIVKALSGEKIFGVLTRENQLDKLYLEFTPIGERIRKAIL